jgi:hypothetical protein
MPPPSPPAPAAPFAIVSPEIDTEICVAASKM